MHIYWLEAIKIFGNKMQLHSIRHMPYVRMCIFWRGNDSPANEVQVKMRKKNESPNNINLNKWMH